MDVRATPRSGPLVVTTDDVLLDAVLAAAAAAEVEPVVVSDVGALRPMWADAPIIVVGVDQAPELARQVLPRRRDIYLVGTAAEQGEVCSWSVPLGAVVAILPEGVSWLTTALASVTKPPAGTGLVVALVGGSGGVGTSTLAAGLAFTAARRQIPAMLVDLDPVGGGNDLLLGAERMEGWRWSRLAAAQGHLGDLSGHLPQVEGVDILSMARDEGDTGEPSVGAVAAVLASAARSHGLVVIDLARELTPAGCEALRLADVTVLITAGGLRGVAAAQRMADRVAPLCADLRTVVRISRTSAVTAALVAANMRLPLLGTIAEDPYLRQAAERGDPPGRAARGRWAKGCRQLVDAFLGARGVDSADAKLAGGRMA